MRAEAFRARAHVVAILAQSAAEVQSHGDVARWADIGFGRAYIQVKVERAYGGDRRRRADCREALILENVDWRSLEEVQRAIEMDQC